MQCSEVFFCGCFENVAQKAHRIINFEIVIIQ